MRRHSRQVQQRALRPRRNAGHAIVSLEIDAQLAELARAQQRAGAGIDVGSDEQAAGCVEQLVKSGRIEHADVELIDFRRRSDQAHLKSKQLGLVVATPIIVVFALALYRMGVLRLSGTLTAVAMSIVIGAVLYFTQ